MSQILLYKTLTQYAERGLAFLLVIAVMIRADLFGMPHRLEGFLLARISVLNVIYSLVFLAGWGICFCEVGSFDAEAFSFLNTGWRVVKGSFFATCALAGILLVAERRLPGSAVLLYFFVCSGTLVAMRVASEWAVENSPTRQKTRVLILGTGPLARRAWREICTKHHRQMEVVGFADTEISAAACPEISANFLGSIDDLQDILLRSVIDCIVIGMPARSCYASIEKAILVGERGGMDLVQFDTTFTLTPATQDKLRNGPKLQSFSQPCLFLALRQVAKRLIDVFVASTLLLLLLPLLVLTAAAIRLTSSGPAIFTQTRYGYRRRKFKVFKFRTMVEDAEKRMSELEVANEAIGPIFKIKNDPRITPIGRFLRKTSIDELPQLWNVITGSMSLVGPRPMSIRDVSLFSCSHTLRRFKVKPGITGLWQVSGRSSTSFEQWIVMDLRYIDTWSLRLDFMILLKTFPAVLRGSGAM